MTVSTLPFPHLAARVFNTPVMISEEKAQIIVGVLSQRMNLIGEWHGSAGATPIPFEAPVPEEGTNRLPSATNICQVHNGVAIIPVVGTLVNKNGLDPYSGMTGYDGVTTKLRACLEDPQVNGILLDIESPGGETSGLFDLADEVFEANKRKPVWSVLTEFAFSAAYALASQCDRILLPRTGWTGSIGVLYLHTDLSAKYEKEGIKVTAIKKGARKTDGSSLGPLSKEFEAKIETEMSKMYDMFVDLVARGRGVDPQAVRDTEAEIFNAEQSIELGLADQIITPDDALMMFSQTFSGGVVPSVIAASAAPHTGKEETNLMVLPNSAASDAASSAGTPSVDPAAGTQASQQPAAQPATPPAAPSGGQASLVGPAPTASAAVDAAAIQAEAGTRIQSILGCDEAKGREAMANHLAFQTQMSADEAKALLAASPKASTLDSRMGKEDEPVLPLDDGSGVDPVSAAKASLDSSAIYGNRAASVAASHDGFKPPTT